MHYLYRIISFEVEWAESIPCILYTVIHATMRLLKTFVGLIHRLVGEEAGMLCCSFFSFKCTKLNTKILYY